ncbi:MAG: GTPase Era [Clostridia bacterium]
MYKFGRVTIVGKPNVGKSTLLNKLIGEKISIVSPKSQTTRDVISGVLTMETSQIVFVDTPGLLKADNPLSKYMVKGIKTATSDVDLILYLFDGEKPLSDHDVDSLKKYVESGIPVIAVLSKLDRADKAKLIGVVEKLGTVEKLVAIIPISVFRNKNLDMLMAEIEKVLPEGEKMYEEDYLTDKPYRFLVAERIREKILYYYNEEIPHGITIELPQFDYDEKKNVYVISADIICEKQSHKGIIIGKQGEALKVIGSKARLDLEQMLDAKVFLTIFVKVKENWRDSESLVSQFGYNKKDFND